MKRHHQISQRLRRDAEAIFMAGLRAVEPARNMKKLISLCGHILTIGDESFDLDRCKRIVIIGAGKAAAAMACSLEKMLGNRISEGAVVVKDGHGVPLTRIEVFEAGHPLPDTRSMDAARRILSLAREAEENDLVLALFSGGGSSLFTLPADGLTLDALCETTKLLQSSGASIDELNIVRKHLSSVKGGLLANAIQPARCVGLLLSDVVGDDAGTIASGPTVCDDSTYGDALEILARYGLVIDVPTEILNHLQAGANGRLPETPTAVDHNLYRNSHWIVASLTDALRAAAAKARTLGYNETVHSGRLEGEAREVGLSLASMARKVAAGGYPPLPACILSGGETTVTLRRPHGLGGRNQELALAAAVALEGCPGIVLLSAGTDGTDGPTDAAGAVADGWTTVEAREKALDPLEHLARHDAYPLFQRLDRLVCTGPTLTNVMDIQVILVAETR